MIRKYHAGKAFLSAFLHAIPFIALPLFLLRAFQSLLPGQLTLEFQVDLVYLESLIITLGTAVVAMAFMTALFEKGLFGRALFGAARQGAKLGWFFFFFNAGLITLLITIENASAGPIPLSSLGFVVSFEQLLLILYIAILVMMGYFIAEYAVYRRVVQEQFYVEPSYY